MASPGDNVPMRIAKPLCRPPDSGDTAIIEFYRIKLASLFDLDLQPHVVTNLFGSIPQALLHVIDHALRWMPEINGENGLSGDDIA